MKINKWGALFLVFIGLFILKEIFIKEDNRTNSQMIDEDYASAWESPVDELYFVEIAKTLVRNKIAGCGQFFYLKKHLQDKNEYALACMAKVLSII